MVHVAGQSRGSPIRSIFSDKAGKGRRNRANVQTFALLQREEGTFPSGGGKCLGEQGKGQAFRGESGAILGLLRIPRPELELRIGLA